jgi:hypothetical protein
MRKFKFVLCNYTTNLFNGTVNIVELVTASNYMIVNKDAERM